MMNQVDEVSIELSNLDEEGESSKFKEVVKAYQTHHQPKIFPKWDIIFTVASAFAVFVDPLSCYIPTINDNRTCFNWDTDLAWIVLALRSAGDLFYGMDILVFIKRRSGNVNAKPFGASWTKHFGGPHSKISKVLNGQKSLRFLGILPRICAALPIMQLFGALWYYFAVDRMIVCWEKANGQHPNDLDSRITRESSFYCRSDNSAQFLPPEFLQKKCAVPLSANETDLPFDFGIYLSALQSNMTLTSSRDLLVMILQCIWWGLRNLSSFGSNLATSYVKSEIIFSILISISGLALFLVYLNSRVQGSEKESNQLKLQQKIETIYPDIIDKMRNMCRLRLASLKKVRLLENKDEKVLKAICEYLKPVTYGEDVYIIREGEPLRKMFFITRGIALTYTTITGGTNVCKSLEKSDFYGEELLNWAFKFCLFSELPISSTTLLSQTKVEAFSIGAQHLKSIVAQFWWHFQRELPRSQLEHFAASSIQAFWLRRRAKAKRASSEGARSQSKHFAASSIHPFRWDKLRH